jgi:hypothetical protein
VSTLVGGLRGAVTTAVLRRRKGDRDDDAAAAASAVPPSSSSGGDGACGTGSGTVVVVAAADTSLIEDQIDVGLQMSSAMMYLHERGIMFRDLKPANVGFDGECGNRRSRRVWVGCETSFYRATTTRCRYSPMFRYVLLIFLLSFIRSSLFFFLCDDVAFFVSLVRGDVKLFDFGLAAIMPPNGDPYEDHFVMSGAGEKGGGMTTLEKTGPAECR